MSLVEHRKKTMLPPLVVGQRKDRAINHVRNAELDRSIAQTVEMVYITQPRMSCVRRWNS